jgi:glycine cleavage system H lipoate-binding protein
VEGFRVPHGLYYHAGHTWLKVEKEDTVRIGLDDFAVRLLGPMDRLEAPLMGKTLTRNRAQIHIIREGRRAGVLSPVSGVVVDCNPVMRKTGETVQSDPYAAGWLLRVHVEDLRGELKRLMLGGETEAYFLEETRRVFGLIEETAGPLAADGGSLADDLAGRLPELDWQQLARMILRS